MPRASRNYERDSVDATLSRIETKLDVALMEVRDHEKRIAALERFRWWLAGAIALGGAGGGVLAAKLLGE